MRVNHGFIAARRRLYGKHVRGLSSVTAPSHRKRSRAHVTAHIFRHLMPKGEVSTPILLSYSLFATFADVDLFSLWFCATLQCCSVQRLSCTI